jgi:hypothetical protein
MKQYNLYLSMNRKCNITQFMIEKYYIYNLLLFIISTYQLCKKQLWKGQKIGERKESKKKKITPKKNIINNNPSKLHLSLKDDGWLTCFWWQLWFTRVAVVDLLYCYYICLVKIFFVVIVVVILNSNKL